MKTINLIIIFFVISFNSISQDEKFTIGLGSGVGIYGGSSNENNKTDTTVVDAACAIISISGEYTFAEKLSAGILIERSGFLTDSASSGKISSLNVFAIEKFRFVDNENNKLYVSLAEGYSYLSFSNSGNHAYGNGYCFQVGAGWEHFFSTNFGMNLSAWYAWYQYYSIIDSDNNTLKVNSNNEDMVLTFSGANVKAGIVIKF